MAIDDDRHTIREELEELKKNGARRQELSLHACKRLFFDLGIRPSMATVRELTQTGSASDIPRDIEIFWQRIRTASKVRIGAGTLPVGLQERAGELLGALYDEALVHAQAAFDAERAELAESQAQAEQAVRDAETRRTATDEILQRSEARAEAAWARVRELESQLAASSAGDAAHQDGLLTTVRKLEAENEALHKRIDTEQATNAELRDRIDTLHQEMRKNTEHYAQQIKDALAEAERRVKPMLVELDSLRSMSSTWQTSQREAGRKEFDFIQQLASAKSRADRLEAQLRERSDEIDALTRQVTKLRGQQNVDTSVAAVLYDIAAAGRLDDAELARIGTAVDGHVELPAHCPKCRDGEPELSHVGQHYELTCPECEHTSGAGNSRLEAVARFLQGKGESTVA